LPFLLTSRSRNEGENKEHHANPWQKIVSPVNDELDEETGHPAWIRKYLDLADLLIKRVQSRLERTSIKKRERNRRDAA
jgi:hypothetical protein